MSMSIRPADVSAGRMPPGRRGLCGGDYGENDGDGLGPSGLAVWMRDRCLVFGQRDLVALDLLVERAPRDAKPGGGPPHVTALVGEDALEMAALQLDKGEAQVVGLGGLTLRRRLELEVLAPDDGAVAQEERTLEHVPQLADVAGPAVRLQRRHRVRPELDGRPPEIRLDALEKIARQGRDVLGPFAQRRNDERDGRDTEIEIAPEALLARGDTEIVVG